MKNCRISGLILLWLVVFFSPLKAQATVCGRCLSIPGGEYERHFSDADVVAIIRFVGQNKGGASKYGPSSYEIIKSWKADFKSGTIIKIAYCDSTLRCCAWIRTQGITIAYLNYSRNNHELFVAPVCAGTTHESEDNYADVIHWLNTRIQSKEAAEVVRRCNDGRRRYERLSKAKEEYRRAMLECISNKCEERAAKGKTLAESREHDELQGKKYKYKLAYEGYGHVVYECAGQHEYVRWRNSWNNYPDVFYTPPIPRFDECFRECPR